MRLICAHLLSILAPKLRFVLILGLLKHDCEILFYILQKLQNIIRKCLERTEMLSLKSISFPAIGTGGFNFPNSEVANCMFKEILTFGRKKNFKSLRKVHVLLHPKDKDNIKVMLLFFQIRNCHLFLRNLKLYLAKIIVNVQLIITK